MPPCAIAIFGAFDVATVDVWTLLLREGVLRPFAALAKGVGRLCAIGAHDRAPEVASQVDFGFELGRDRIIAVGNKQIEKAVVIRV